MGSESHVIEKEQSAFELDKYREAKGVAYVTL